ncbi:unnamed protein product [Meloidogyne enterolobii]|uniref:Uncharacterized protein n=1 Tax=Meloidogyne enterolobii TaxID=390850 RepID=A0ACB1A9E1_MELEN
MKFIKVLIFLIFNSTFWSLINSVKNKKDLIRVEGTSTDLTQILTEGAESSSVNPQILKYKETSSPKSIAKEKKKLWKKEYNKNYYQKNKEKIKEIKNSENYKENKKKSDRKYYQNNKEKMQELQKEYYLKNKQKYIEKAQKWNKTNVEKRRVYSRKYSLKKKNEKENLQNDSSSLGKTKVIVWNSPLPAFFLRFSDHFKLF